MTLSVSQWIDYGPVSIQYLSSLRFAGFCLCTALNCAAVKQALIITLHYCALSFPSNFKSINLH